MYEIPSKKSSSPVPGYARGYALGLLIFFGMAESGGCSVNADRFRSAARNEGLTGAVQGPYNYFECGSGDTWVGALTAKRGDVPVSGTMCCGLLKGCTGRWE